jgi:DNA-binding beta-propeller fold protein YncE
MTPIDSFERQLPDGLADLAGARMPGYLDDILEVTGRTRQRPRWTFFERWLPVSVITNASRSAPLRAAWTLLVVGLLTVALAVGLAFAGSQLLRENDPTRLNGGLLVPTVELDQTWDAAAITGLSQPSGLDVGPDGNLYVVNAGASEILVLDPDGNVVRRWGERGTGDGQFIFHGDPTDPTATFGGVAVSPDGSSVYVTDDANDRVQRFDANGDFVRTWGRYGTDDGEFLAPFDVSAGPDGSVYVVDNSREDIQHFDGEGAYLGRIAGGSGDAVWSLDGGLAVDDEGHVFNVDYDGGLLRSWSRDGAFRWSVGDGAEGPAKLALPADVATDADGYVYVSEPDRVVVFRPDGTLASTWDAPADAADEEWLPIAVGTDGAVYLSARSANVIYKLRTIQREPMDLDTGEGEVAAPHLASAAPTGDPDASGTRPPIRSLAFDTFSVPLSLEVPPGWDWGDEYPGKASVGVDVADDPATTSVVIQMYAPTKVYADPCQPYAGPATVAAQSDIDTIAAVLAEQPGLRLVTPMTDVAIDGHPGISFDQESMNDMKDCLDKTWEHQWSFRSATGEEFSGLAPGQHHRLIVLDVDGTPVIIEVWSFPWSSRDDLIEADAIVDSIDFR